jgi:DNA-binding response OmpR family regulator
VAKILIVDDDPDMVEAGRYVLEKHGHTVRSASNIEAGLKALDEETPDLLIPILMLTSVNQAMGLNIGKDEEMVPVDEFVEKPVNPAVLVSKVAGLLAAKGA